jgi:pectate lyase
MLIKKNATQLLLTIIFLVVLNNPLAFSQSDKEYLITNYGAIGDGKTLNTQAIQNAINTANLHGGGKVIVPKGIYLIGTIELKSDVELYLQKNATLLGSIHQADYKSLEMEGRPETPKKDDNSQLALLVAFKANNISISGKGTIDGQGRELALNIDSLHHAGVAIDPDYNYQQMRPSPLVRPKLVRFSMCKNVTLLGVNCRNPAMWGLSFELCENLKLDSLDIDNRAYWNNDGIDITDSKNVVITNCNVNAADDGICLKSYYPGYYSDSVYIANCTIRSSASAIKFGTASYGGFKNVTIEKIKVYDTFRSAIAIESVDGGFIENIKVSNIIAENTGNAIFIRLGYRDGERPGSIKNVHISDMNVQIPFIRPDINYELRALNKRMHHNPAPSSIVGIPEHYIHDVVIENINISYPGRASKGKAYVPLSRLNQVPEQIKNYPEFSMFGELPAWGFYIRHAKGITMKNINLYLEDKDYRPAFVFDDVIGINMNEIILPKEKQNNQFILKNVSGFEMKPRKEEQIKIIE